MRALTDRGIIACGCVVLTLLPDAPGAAVSWLLAAVVVSGAGAFAGTVRAPVAASAAYLALGCLSSWSLCGAPLLVHDLARALALRSRGTWLLLPCCAPLLAALARDRAGGAPATALCAVACALAAALAVRTAQGELAGARLHDLRDDLQARLLELEDTNARLLEAQEHEGRAAVLSERTRIARDIHDTVGHLLTRLVVQTRALQIVHRDEPAVVAELTGMGATLDEALDAMRRSVHALADEGEDLPAALNLLGSRCGIGRVTVDCDPDRTPPPAVARCLVALTREALTNAARHGAADRARVTLAEYPAFWRLTVANDGAAASPARLRGGEGLGLRSMRERVESLGGTLRIVPGPRFTVFATIPKEDA